MRNTWAMAWISDVIGERPFWAAILGAIVGGVFVWLGTITTMRSERRTAMEVLDLQELQQLASELPKAFIDWRTAVDAHLDDQADGNLARSELYARLRLMSLRARLAVNEDYIATEIDSSITSHLDWFGAEGNLDRDEATMRIAAATIFVTSNLPGRLRDAIDARLRRRGRRWRRHPPK